MPFHPPFCYTIFQKAGSSFFQSKLGVDRFQTHYRKLDFFFCSSNSNKELIPYYVDIYVYKTSSIVLIGGILAVLRVILSDESGYKKFGILGLTFLPFSKFCNLFHFEKSSKLGKTKCNEENSSSNKSLLQVSYTQIHHYSSSTFPISIN